jgi:FkbM family methyltransferase
VTIEEGDVVIDGGAAWGETALMFSAKTGPAGRVVAVECVPEVLSVFYENMALNPSDGERIDLVNQALWDVCDETVIFEEDGPASKVLGVAGRANTGTTHTTVTIDELVRRFELPKVDFIKMDIEGSELAALVGASDTLRRFRPKLAVSAYHKPEDLHVLPLYLSGLGLGYRLFLDHFSNHFEESVLFAVVD